LQLQELLVNATFERSRAWRSNGMGGMNQPVLAFGFTFKDERSFLSERHPSHT
jgi:hypothetical protein